MTPSSTPTSDPTEVDLDRLRVDNIGSLLRPEGLKQAFTDNADDRISDNELRAAQDEAITAVVARQEQIGMPVITDGEFRRCHFNESFADVSGFASGHLAPIAPSKHNAPQPKAAGGERVGTVLSALTERMSLVRCRSADEYRFVQAKTELPVKATLINPDGIAQRYDEAGTPQSVYADTSAFLEDVIRIEREMITELIDAGCRYIQIDAPRYGAYLDENWRADMRSKGRDPEADLRRAIAAENSLIDGFPDDVTFALHVCRGNRRSQWHFEGPYEEIAEDLFSVSHDRLLLEYDNESHGGFEPLARIPGTAVAVLGLITSKTGEVESADDLKRRIDDASKYIDIDRLALSPQCGFATVLEGNLLTEDAQWRKLELMLEVAEEVWGS